MKDPAFLFYPGDWLSGTQGMTLEQKGAYLELLIMQFNRGHMTSHMIGQVVGQNWDFLQSKFKKDNDGLWYNERLDVEKDRRKHYIESRKNNKTGANQYTENGGGHMTGDMTDHMETNIIIEKGVQGGRKTRFEICKEFYELEIQKSIDDKYYKWVVDTILKDGGENTLSNVLKIPQQLKYDEYLKLAERIKQKNALNFKFNDTLIKINNTKKYWKDKASLYHTLITWIDNSVVFNKPNK